MAAVFIALGIVVWLFFFLVCIGLARTAARGDVWYWDARWGRS
jgi:lipopolysaccharide/colanic/teichoic acid biosynthesis glycosyltransferase